jgi:hypothetical protein
MAGDVQVREAGEIRGKLIGKHALSPPVQRAKATIGVKKPLAPAV